MNGTKPELTAAEKIILGLYGDDAQAGDCLWGGNMVVGFSRARAAGIEMEEYNGAGDALVRDGYLAAAENNYYTLTQKGLAAKASGMRA